MTTQKDKTEQDLDETRDDWTDEDIESLVITDAGRKALEDDRRDRADDE